MSVRGPVPITGLRECRQPFIASFLRVLAGPGFRGGGGSGSLQHELPLAARIARRDRGAVTSEACCRAVYVDADAAPADLAAAVLACPRSRSRPARCWTSTVGRSRLRARRDHLPRPQTGSRCWACSAWRASSHPRRELILHRQPGHPHARG